MPPGSCHPGKALEQPRTTATAPVRDIPLWGWGDIFKNTEYALNQRPQDPKRYWGTMSPKRRIHVLAKQGVETGLAPPTIIPNDMLENCTSCPATLCSAKLKVLVPKRVHIHQRTKQESTELYAAAVT